MPTDASGLIPVVSPSTRSGMGTILFPGGAAFRVWAPFATAVFVSGDFNQWSTTANPLAREENGLWSVDVLGVKIGDEYQFVILSSVGETLKRINPYASQVTNSAGNGKIHDPNFDWTGDNFAMPLWNELVIYEMHVGTFNDPQPSHPGTFDRIIQKLSYLNSLGINAIEIMPIGEFPGERSWGYDPSLPFAVESALGGDRKSTRLNSSHSQI